MSTGPEVGCHRRIGAGGQEVFDIRELRLVEDLCGRHITRKRKVRRYLEIRRPTQTLLVVTKRSSIVLQCIHELVNC